MAKVNLSSMDVGQLLELRNQVDNALSKRRSELEKQLAQLGTSTGIGRGRRGISALKGIKVAAKYRGPSGETWAGRGAKPRWLVAAMEDTGKRIEEFLIEERARTGRRKRRAKR